MHDVKIFWGGPPRCNYRATKLFFCATPDSWEQSRAIPRWDAFMIGALERVIKGVLDRRDLKQEAHPLVPYMTSRWQATGPCQSSLELWLWKKIRGGKKQSGWILGHLSVLQQGVIFKRKENCTVQSQSGSCRMICLSFSSRTSLTITSWRFS